MNRRRTLCVLAAAVGSPACDIPALAGSSNCSEHVAWVANLVEKMQTVKVGDTRASLLRVLTTQGGLSTAMEQTFVHPDCLWFKIDVKFRAVVRPERHPDGRSTSVENDNDIIIALSRLYLEAPVMD